MKTSEEIREEIQTKAARLRAEALLSDKLGYRVEWVDNIGDPRLPRAMFSVVRPFTQPMSEAWREHLLWLQDKIIAEPCGTDTYTPEKLKDMGMVGVYRKVTEGKELNESEIS